MASIRAPSMSLLAGLVLLASGHRRGRREGGAVAFRRQYNRQHCHPRGRGRGQEGGGFKRVG